MGSLASRYEKVLGRYTRRLDTAYKVARDKYDAHRIAEPILKEMAQDPEVIPAVLTKHIDRAESFNTKNFPSLGFNVAMSPHYVLVANAFFPLDEGPEDMMFNAIHHHGDLLLSTVNAFGPGYEHWVFGKAVPIDLDKDLFDIPLQEKGIHTLHNCAFVDADQPHAVVYPKTLTVTFALWSSKKAVTWRDHVKRLPGVRGREKTLRDLALKLGLRKTLDLKTCEYYDYYPADGAFKGMRQRVQFERGPNEDYLQSFFNVLQETGNERLIPLIFESIDGKKIDNPETVRRFAADLRAGKRIPNKYSAGIHTNVPHMNFRAADVVKNLPRSRAA
mgnify:CR=1 FL=1